MTTKNTDKNLVMRDYAYLDPRSVRASLEGRDDGRAARYERYYRRVLARKNGLSLQDVIGGGMRAANLPLNDDGRSLVVRRVVPLVGLCVGIWGYFLMF